MIAFSNLQDQFNQYVETHLFENEPAELYAPINYILSLGGKRLRPILLLMAYNLFEEEVENVLPAAMAIEVFHNFSLIHDDIMDEAELRRGKQAVHLKFNINDAILSGDVMLIYAYKYLSQIKGTKFLPEIYSAFNENAIKVCEGQQMDVNFETRDDVLISEYIKMIEYKTSVLIGVAMQIAAFAANQDKEAAQHLYDFGRYMGIAFQIQDDMLDAFGNAEKVGKKIGGDIIQNKKTFLFLKTLEKADEQDAQALIAWFSKKHENELAKVDAVKALFNKYEIKEMALSVMSDYKQKAFDCLDQLKINSSKKEYIKKFSLNLIEREY